MGQMLRSWKEIARHMGASVRTVQRWESELRLPVRRIEARRGAVVFAFPSELDSWVRVRSDTQARLVEDSYFRNVFMDSQFPSLVVDDTPRILVANFAACDLTGAGGEQLLGQTLQSFLLAEDGGGLPHWGGFLQSGACMGQANLQCRDGRVLGVEFVLKRFSPGLHVLSVLSAQKPWRGKQIWCRPVESDFSFHVRTGSSPGGKRGSATLR
jgi:PAS domain-containing protein